MPRSSKEDWRQGRSDAIRRLLGTYAPGEDEDLLFQMVVTICRLAVDGTDRGDLKLLNHALKELRYAFKVFAPYTDIRKVSIFGSSRTPEDHPQYLEAKKLAGVIQSNGWMVITGAGDGIMRAGHHGATRESSFGVAISLPFEQATNTIIADDPKLVNFKYFFTRKLVFVKEANAIVLFPGGFGTQDEGFESLTLVQTLKTTPMPIVLCDEPGGTYWQHWRSYVTTELLGNGMIDPADMDLFFLTDRAEDAVDEILTFYRRYHSSRFVGEQQVLRLNHPVSAETLAEINDTFADLLIGGRFEQLDHPLKEENGAYPDKTRLVFAFDRRSAGRLRLLINRINEEGAD
ncbi:MAG: LOG family protein [Planctomycetota bacterium]